MPRFAFGCFYCMPGFGSDDPIIFQAGVSKCCFLTVLSAFLRFLTGHLHSSLIFKCTLIFIGRQEPGAGDNRASAVWYACSASLYNCKLLAVRPTLICAPTSSRCTLNTQQMCNKIKYLNK